MVKKAKAIEQYQVNLYCDKCGKRIDKYSQFLTTYPPQYVYQCECGWKTTTTDVYPHTVVVFDETNAEILPDKVIEVCSENEDQ